MNFVIELDGSISNITVVRGMDNDFIKIAFELIRRMPKWSPAIHKEES